MLVDEFLSIQKQPDESLSALIGRVDASLQKLRSSHDAQKTLKDFESELAYMTLIRALPSEFETFRSSLLMLNGESIDLDKVKAAFLQEEQARAPRC